MPKGPTFLIIGAAKCGTTSLYHYLKEHPNIFLPKHKELHFFDNQNIFAKKAVSYQPYLKHFKTNDPNIIHKGEASPIYCYLPECIERIHKFDPNLKLIMLLRDPVKRAISHYWMEVKMHKREKLSLEEAIENESKRHKVIHSYCSRGLYVDQIDHILKHFPREQLHLTRLEDLSQKPQETLNHITDYLEVKNITPAFKKHFANNYPEPKEETITKLANYFKPYNDKLHQKYGIKVDDWL